MTTNLPAPDAASGSHHPPLNYYGELARQWEGCLPEIYQQIRDPRPRRMETGSVLHGTPG